MKENRKIKKDNVGGLRDRLELMDIGLDSDDSGMGLIIILVIILVIIAMIIAVMLGVGAIIGGFYSIRNYILAFRNNVHIKEDYVTEEA
ncbi:MAG TPA: hypothetical protein DEP67_07595 [Lachnospiraceae bacterium]|nr:hypothetical protein [Lachnospiraceae bacterium]